MGRGCTLLGQEAEELQAVQLEFKGLVPLLRRCQVVAAAVHPLQGGLQVPQLNLQ